MPASAVPLELSHQGRVFDSAGSALVGPNTLDIALYDSSTATTPLWSESHSVSFDDGYFDVVLGSDVSNPLDSALFDQSEVWVAINLGGSEVGRQRVRSVPYALHSGTATHVDGGVVDASEIRVGGNVVINGSGSFTGGDTLGGLSCAANQLPLYDGAAWTCAPAGAGTLAWDSITAKPAGFADDIDDDVLGGLSCTQDQVAAMNAGVWTCRADQTLDETAVDLFVANNGFAQGADLSAVATTGSYVDLTDVPADLADGDDVLDETAVDFFVANNGYALASSLSAVATSGSWTDLANVPAGFADGVDNDTQLDEAAVDAFVANNGYVVSSTLAPVATTGAWADLQNVPTGFADGVDNTLDETAVDAFVSDNGYAQASTLSALATSGSWNDLQSVPTALADGVVAWGELTGVPGTFADGQIAWAELTGIPGALSDGDVDWSDLVGVPADFADGDIAWTELSAIPGDIADGDDVLDQAGIVSGLVGADVAVNSIIAVSGLDADTLSGKTLEQVECESRLGEWTGSSCTEYVTLGCTGCTWDEGVSACSSVGRHMCTSTELLMGAMHAYQTALRQGEASGHSHYVWGPGYNQHTSPDGSGNEMWYPGWGYASNDQRCVDGAAIMWGWRGGPSGGASGCYTKTYTGAMALCCRNNPFP